MSIIDQHLSSGEHVLCSLHRKSLLGGEEALAATDSRIVHVSRGQLYDISYSYLSSLENKVIVDWRWGRRALYLLALALLLAFVAAALPGIAAESSRAIEGSVGSATEAIGGYVNDAIGQYLEFLNAPMTSFQGDAPSSGDLYRYDLSPDLSTAMPELDIDGLAGPASVSAAELCQRLSWWAFALAAISFFIFLSGVKRAIIIKSPTDTHLFFYPGNQKGDSREFIRVARGQAGKARGIAWRDSIRENRAT
jgi:hypothetical protein